MFVSTVARYLSVSKEDINKIASELEEKEDNRLQTLLFDSLKDLEVGNGILLENLKEKIGQDNYGSNTNAKKIYTMLGYIMTRKCVEGRDKNFLIRVSSPVEL